MRLFRHRCSDFNHIAVVAILLIVCLSNATLAQETPKGKSPDAGGACIDCHKKLSPALVMEWQRSRHAQSGIECLECHGAENTDVDGWTHHGFQISALVTPKDCARCHEQEYQQFARSHHAKAGQILASLDNVLAERAAGMPANNADAVNGCWQCHGATVKLMRDKEGKVVRTGDEGNRRSIHRRGRTAGWAG